MPKGGPRATSGPAPDPNALRRDRKDDKAGWINLPATFDGPVPAWPLPPLPRYGDDTDSSSHQQADATEQRELELWEELWRLPQAAMWGNFVQLVAMYARIRVAGETSLNSKMLAEARMRENALGISPDGMLRFRWRVIDQPASDERTQSAQPNTQRRKAEPSLRDRFKVIEGGDQS